MAATASLKPEMKRQLRNWFILFYITGLQITGYSQNIVHNASFDTSVLSPSYYGQICYPTGWYSPSGYCTVVINHGSPDYYKTGGTGGSGPPATFWATVNTHSGAGMTGFATYYPGYTNFREYVATTLAEPLVPGQVYNVSFWVTNGITWLNGHATNNIGVAFTTASLTQPAAAYIAVTPQVEYTDVLWDTLWHQLSFSFTATDASQYMTIGNFRTDAASIITTMKTVCCPTSSAAYYYLDDIVVEKAMPLPLELLSFTANEQPESVLLNWETANEKNTDVFIVERSAEGQVYYPIGSVPASGNSITIKKYTFTDDAPMEGINYYRLRCLDQDGTGSFSHTVSVTMPDVFTFTISPNPVSDIVNFEVHTQEPYSIRIFDASGKCITAFDNKEGERSVLEADLRELPPGVYYAHLVTAHKTVMKKFIKIR